MERHDLPVDLIVTPFKVYDIRTTNVVPENRLSKPMCGVLWDRVTEEMWQEIPILTKLREWQTQCRGQ